MKQTLFLLSAGLLLFISCSSDSGSSAPRSDKKKIAIATSSDPESLDPRRGRLMVNITPAHMFFEGLTRDDGSEPVLAIAERVEVSSDSRVYTFFLRETSWSNGDLLTAYDFAETWKTMVDPAFPAAFGYQLSVLKNGKEISKGSLPIENLGVEAIDSHTLRVELEEPSANFLALTSTRFFFPVHQSLREASLEKDIREKEDLICNGPFQFVKWKKQNEVVAERNPLYWDASQVELDEVTLVNVEQNTAIQLFEESELDWIGSPLSTLPVDSFSHLAEKELLHDAASDGTYFFRINTDLFPLNHSLVRRALALAINRSDLVEKVLRGSQIPATGFVPPLYQIRDKEYFTDGDEVTARAYFEAGLRELGLSKEEFPSLVIQFSMGDRNKQIAQVVQQQWSQALGIPVVLEQIERKTFYDHLQTGDFAIGLGSWFADYTDPFSYLEIFKTKDNSPNCTNWEKPQYTRLLDLAFRMKDLEKKQSLLFQAERLLMNEMPIIPLFHSTFHYAANEEKVEGVYFSSLGYLDFKHVRMNEH